MTQKLDVEAPLSPAQFRRLFPVLDEAPHFASCSQGAISDHLAHTMQRFVGMLTTSQAPWEAWVTELESFRTHAGRQLTADPEHIAVLSCASECAFQIVSSLDWTGERNRLVTSELEFPSIGNVWRAQRAPIEVVQVAGADAALEAESWIPQIDERTKLVSIPLVSYANGARPDVAAVIQHARSVGAKVVVDAYQGAGIVPFSVDELDCDYLFTGNLKYLLGLPGVAMLYAKDVDPEVPAGLTGWFARREPFAFDATLVDYPANARRFEIGTPPVPSVYAGVAGMQLVERIDADAAWAHVQALRDRLAAELIDLGLQIDLPAAPEHRGPQVAILDENPEALAEQLATTHRIGAAPRGQRLRLSLHAYSSDRDIDALLQALRAAGRGRRG